MDTLLDAVWGDTPPDTAVKTLQKYISQLRTELKAPGLIESKADGYQLGTTDVDSRRFEDLIDRAESEPSPERAAEVLTEALALWRGEPYPDLPDLGDAVAERQRLAERRLAACESLADARLALGQYGPLIGWVEQLLAAHPLRERLWGVLMLALYRSGRQAEALSAFQRLRASLIEELGAEPTPALCALHDRILRQEDEAAPPPVLGRPPHPSTIPLNLTGFVGREAELGQLAALLESGRLVTLTGSAGSGKTRLAVELLAGGTAERLAAAFRDGAWFVELAGLRDGDRIPAVVAGVLRLQEQPGQDIEDVLLNSLGVKSLLLVLDNCEHLLDRLAELVPRWLRVAPRLRVLATSRQPLGVGGEYVLEVPPLPVPVTNDPVEVEASESVRLLTQRALAVDSGFRVSSDNAAAVASIARRLDGMPLALELAAARLRVFDAQRLADLLDDRFRVLVTTLRTTPERHQTLLAAIGWSYDLLSEEEQALFRALSVFEGGFTLEAAERVGGEDGTALTLLPALVERSLVVVDRRAGSNRYRLLESLCEYGRAQLEPEESYEYRRRHLHWYLELAERAEAGIRGPHYRSWLDLLNAEGDNLRAALRWSLVQQRTTGIRFAAALAPYWDEATYYSEGARWLRDAIADSAGVPAELGALVLAGAARLAIGQGDHDHAAELTERSLTLAQEAKDEAGVIRATALRANVALYQGNYAEAGPLLEESLAGFGRLGLTWEQSEALARLGHMHRLSGKYGSARARLNESLALRKQIGDVVGRAWVFWQLGVLARYEGDYERAATNYAEALTGFEEIADTAGAAHVQYSMGDIARLSGNAAGATSLYEASLSVLRDVGDQRCTASIQFNLAVMALDRVESDLARTLLRESLVIRRRLNDRGGIAECLEAFAGIEQARQEPVAAVRLLAAADALRTRTGAARPASDDQANADRLRTLRAVVGTDDFTDAWQIGQGLDIDAIIAPLLRPD
jgi:predicted ATPase/DNA-binding SARP family transcriptional activator